MKLSTLITYAVIVIGIALYIGQGQSFYTCNNTLMRRKTTSLYGLTVFSEEYESDISKWIRAKYPDVKNDWKFRGGGGILYEACGGPAPNYSYLSMLFKHRDEPLAAEYLNEVLESGRKLSEELRSKIENLEKAP